MYKETEVRQSMQISFRMFDTGWFLITCIKYTDLAVDLRRSKSEVRLNTSTQPLPLWNQVREHNSILCGHLKKGKVIPLQARCGPEGG